MSTDTRLPETTEDELVEFFEIIIKNTPLRSMAEIAADPGPVTAKQTDTVEFPVTSPGPRHLKPYRGPSIWRRPLAWAMWNFGWLYWGLDEQNRHGSHRVV